MTAADGLHLTLERAGVISETQPARHSTMRQVAQSLSRRNADAAVCELMNEALQRVVDLAFEEDTGGLINIDNVTGRILFPLPWGRKGYRQWGMRPLEARIMRTILVGWIEVPRGMPPLFMYEAASRNWRINLVDYPDRRAASRWLPRHTVRVSEYRTARSGVLVGT